MELIEELYRNNREVTEADEEIKQLHRQIDDVMKTNEKANQDVAVREQMYEECKLVI